MVRVTTFVALCGLTGVALAKCAPQPYRLLRVRADAYLPRLRSMDHALVIMDERRRARRADEELTAAATVVRCRCLAPARSAPCMR
jgi:hypothetical protein